MNKIGNIIVNNTNEVLCDINNKIYINEKNGYSFLIRIKNEESTIEKCIIDIIDLADEIIIVDNNSSDNTLNIILELEKKYKNIFVYQYKIDVPRCGKEHSENYLKGGLLSNNTLTNYYNWTLSKATYNKKIKWDGDFYAIKENCKELLDEYRNSNHLMAVWFSGLTLFIHNEDKYFKNNSYYDEHRMFYNIDKKIWSDNIYNGNNICETSINFVNSISCIYKFKKPVFIEIKNTNKDEFTSRSSLLDDERDNVDYNILKNLKNNILDGIIYDLLVKSNNIYEDSKVFKLNKYSQFTNENINEVENNLIKLIKLKKIGR
jgi:hypothetical protein